MIRINGLVAVVVLLVMGGCTNAVDTSRSEHKWRCERYVEWVVGFAEPGFLGIRGHVCEPNEEAERAE